MPSINPGARAPSLRDPKSLIEKDLVHVLKASSCRLWIKQPGNRHEACIEYSPNYVQSISKVLNSLRGDIYDHKVREPMRGCTESDPLVARAKRHDL